jgi:hypothetical protein
MICNDCSEIRALALFLFIFFFPDSVFPYSHTTPLVKAAESHHGEESIGDDPAPAGLAQETHEISDVYLMVDNQGLIGHDQTTFNGFGFFPRGTPNNYLFASGLWFGAMYDADDDGVSDKAFTMACAPMAWYSEFREGRNDQDPHDPLTRVFDSTEQSDLAEWPPQFSDSLSGDPILFSDQDLVTTYTTKDHAGSQLQMPLEVNQRSMALIAPDSLDQVIFFVFEVTNWSDKILEDAWIGFAAQLEVGIFGDDLSSVIFDRITPEADTVTLDMIFEWDSAFSEENFTGEPGFVGISLLFGPGNPEDGVDNDGDGIIDESIDNRIDDDSDGLEDEWDEEDVIGLVSYSQFCNPNSGGAPIDDPTNDVQGYDILSCNTAGSQYQCFEGTEPSYNRSMLSSGPFDWLPGQVRTVAFAYIFANAVGAPDRIEFVGDPPRPDPNNPALGELVRITEKAREHFCSLYPPLAIDEDFEGKGPGLPRTFTLHQNFPNPFNPSTTILYDIPAESGSIPVRILVYDLRGRLIRTLADEVRKPGRQQVHWDGRDDRGHAVPSGIYLYCLESGKFTSTRKMIVLQ